MDEWKVKDHVFSVIDGLQYNLLYSVYTLHCILLANYNQRKNSSPGPSPPPSPLHLLSCALDTLVQTVVFVLWKSNKLLYDLSCSVILMSSCPKPYIGI